MQAYLAKKSMLFLAITTAILLIVGFVFYCVPLFFLALTPCHFHCKDIRFLSGLVNKVLELRTVCCEAQPYLSYSQRCVVHFHMLRATFISENIVVLVLVVFFKLWCQINVNGIFCQHEKSLW